ncbi:MAG: aryl-sulfate sulfotransferase, partial [Clostridiales bacterium]|nr:aryl-sulfate sulfotransferase [Clostridiales bacterium]
MKKWKNRNTAAFLGIIAMLCVSAGAGSLASFCAVSAEESAVVHDVAGWQISLEDALRTSSLNTVSVTLGYASVETNDLEQAAADGYEYCLLKLSIVKGDSTEPIEWEKVFLTDGDGNSYSRIDDSFITDYDMSRIPGTDLNFGSYEGWICFEVPEKAEDLTFTCSFEAEELEIPVVIEEETGTDAEAEAAAETGDGTKTDADSSTADAGDTDEETGLEAVTESGDATETNADSATASRTDTETATEAGTDETADSDTEADAWTEIEYSDELEQQSAIDDALYGEAQKGYSFEDPFIVVNPYQNLPLTAIVIFTTEEETGVDVVVCGKSEENNITTSFEADTTHILPIYGLYAGDTTDVVLTLDDGQSVTLEIATEALDTDLDDTEVTVCEDGVLEDGELTFASIQAVHEGACGAVAYDNAGDIRWYMDEEYISTFPWKRLSNGRMMAATSDVISGYYYYTGLMEFDLCGKIYSIYLIPGGEHHDFIELANGNLLVCSCSEDFSVIEDRIVEIDRETGEVVYELSVSDLIEPGDGGSENATESDWCHNNSIDYDEETDTILLSCRHLDAVLGIDKTNKELKWIIGDPSEFTSVSEDLFFTPVDSDDDFEWQYAQHNATFLPDGDILFFDNGTHRTKTGSEDEGTTGDEVYSRAVRYHIDTENMTIEQVWSYGKERGKEWYSSFISGADYLDEDTYWITSGSNSYDPDADTYDLTVAASGTAELCTYIDMVVGDELVYELTIPAQTYRSFRDTLYTEENTYSVTEEGVWYGSLGSVAQADEITINTDTAAEIDFTLSELVELPSRLQVSGSWPVTGEDALLVLVSESGETCCFTIEASSASTSDDAENFSLWITAESVTAGHRYYIYLYNEGILYTTHTY